MRWSMGSVADSVVANLSKLKINTKEFCKIYTNNNLTLIQFIPTAKIFFPMILQPPSRENGVFSAQIALASRSAREWGIFLCAEKIIFT